MKKCCIVCLLGISFSFPDTHAQVSHGGRPLPAVATKSYQSHLFEEMPPVDTDELLRTEHEHPGDLRGGYRFACKFMTNFSRTNSGSSFTLPDGTRVWMLGIRSQGALSVNVLFTEYELPEGAQVFLYNSSRTHILGAFNHLNNSARRMLPVAPVRGDELIIEYREPAGAAFPGRLTVGEVNHGYRSLKAYEPAGDKSEYACMPAPVCFGEEKGLDPVSRSAVLLIIDGVTACTGVMVNNTLNDGTPYLLTASHCLNKDFSITNPDYEAVAGRIVCFFNYASPTCDTVMRGTEEMSVASAIYRAANEKTDMMLLELAEAPPAYYQPYYAGWNIEESGGVPPYAGIHHPTASVKRINISENSLSLQTFDIKEMEFLRNAHWNIGQWDVGSTATGSSGSPLFDASNHLVGLLSGGRSTCQLPVDDYYYALFKAWEPSAQENGQLKRWLNPSGADRTTLDGLDPFDGRSCYRLSHISGLKLQDSIRLSELPPPATGYLFGVNSLRTDEYAEEYRVNGEARIDGVYLVTSPAGLADKDFQVEIRVYGDDAGPGVLLHAEPFRPVYMELSVADSTFISTEKRLGREQESFVRFHEPVPVSGAFYIGYKISASAPSSFAVYNLPQGQTALNTAWVKYRNEWIEASSHPLTPFATSLFVDAVVHYTDDMSGEIPTTQDPAIGIWVDARRRNVHLLLPDTDGANCLLYSPAGQLLIEKTVVGSEASLSVEGLRPGIYVIHIRGNGFSCSQKIYLQ
ncbi:MAG: T9SS type A sorting domain-containing protein [Tannerellaceae bacterium]|nr:T9SS type A sorting domain-containing protein [Tannerellaceae bacterium]